MAKSNAEKSIDEMKIVIAVLDERVTVARKELDASAEERKVNDGKFTEVEKRLAVLDDRVSDLKKAAEEAAKRSWTLWQMLLIAFVGGLITLAGQFMVQMSLRVLFSGKQ